VREALIQMTKEADLPDDARKQYLEFLQDTPRKEYLDMLEKEITRAGGIGANQEAVTESPYGTW